MAAPRSPNYPRASLKEALEGIDKIYKQDHRNRITPEAAIHHMGYKGMNGSAQVALSVLRKYGLIEDDKGSGKVRVSALAVDLIEGRDNPEVYRQALSKAAFFPTLFQEIRRDFPESLPSADSLRFHLVRKGFNSDAAVRATKSYRETMELVTGAGATYTGEAGPIDNAGRSEIAARDGADLEDRDYAHEGEEHMEETQTRSVPPLAPLKASPVGPPQAGFKQDVFTLGEGDVVLRWPEGLAKESFPDLQDWLEIMQRKIAREIGAELKQKP